MTQTEGFGGASWQIDFGTGRRTEVELDASGGIWLATGQLTPGVDVWMKESGGILDLRVRVQRTEDGLSVAIDRGDNAGSWWQGYDAPRLLVKVGQNNVAEVRARIGGSADSVADHLLGRITVGQ